MSYSFRIEMTYYATRVDLLIEFIILILCMYIIGMHEIAK